MADGAMGGACTQNPRAPNRRDAADPFTRCVTKESAQVYRVWGVSMRFLRECRQGQRGIHPFLQLSVPRVFLVHRKNSLLCLSLSFPMLSVSHPSAARISRVALDEEFHVRYDETFFFTPCPLLGHLFALFPFLSHFIFSWFVPFSLSSSLPLSLSWTSFRLGCQHNCTCFCHVLTSRFSPSHLDSIQFHVHPIKTCFSCFS